MKKLANSRYYIWYAVVILVLVACTNSGVDSTTSSLSTPIPVSASPLATPTIVLPTSSPGMATVVGTLVVMDPMFGGPKNGDSIYLVPIDEELTDDLVVVPEIDPENSYKATRVNSTTGEFVFTNIPPGRYQILIEIAPGIIPPRSMETGGIDFLTIEADQVVDMGRLQIP